LQTPDPHFLAQRIERWFQRHQRPLPWRETYDPYMVWVSEVMLQQTRMEVVLRYYTPFIARFPDIATLAAASETDVLAAWSGLGYYRRAKMLHAGAIEVARRCAGVVPSTLQELRGLPGIGRYTSGAIASIAWNVHAPIVDGNVARIVARLFGVEKPVGSPALMREAWLHAEALVDACSKPRIFNQGLMELGALVCTPRKPDCKRCPLSSVCVAFATDRVERIPAPKQTAETRSLQIPLYVVLDRKGRLLMRRESGPLMRDMYHLPHGNSELFTDTPLVPASASLIGSFRHTVTTRRIQFTVYRAVLGARVRDRAGYEWIEPGSIAAIPHPSYVGKALRLIAAN
jgi:A/G-specific adenine glycosylase